MARVLDLGSFDFLIGDAGLIFRLLLKATYALKIKSCLWSGKRKADNPWYSKHFSLSSNIYPDLKHRIFILKIIKLNEKGHCSEQHETIRSGTVNSTIETMRLSAPAAAGLVYN
jgi:hypothetical protein